MPATYSQDAPAAAGSVELSSPTAAAAALAAARERTLHLVAHLSEAQLERQHSPIMSPLVWDLAHIAAYEDLWLAHRHAGLELLRPELAERYDAFETPRAVRGEISLLDTPQARTYLREVRERVLAAIGEQGVGDGVLHEMVVRHELQHTETMRQVMAIVGLLPAGEPPSAALDAEAGWIELPAGTFAMGAGLEGFAYDNERPRHMRETGAFRIAKHPVTKASWLHFSEGGGYARREWWSDEGWAWKQQYDITHHPDVATGDPQSPVCHVSWFEADAFARAHGARLPSEAEWERAATWEQPTGAGKPRSPGTGILTGGQPPYPGTGTLTGGKPPYPGTGTLADIGCVWEWTATNFHGYPGFTPYPYREYSEVFFGERYRVLRGGSWATSPRVATRTFRNWDLPERRQIFSGVRLAQDI
jgi:iron(II)-dependent oxidoreductase